MGTRLANLIVDATDPLPLSRFWGALLGWPVTLHTDDEIDLTPPDADGFGMDLIFVPVPESKTRKNRIHLDLRSRSAVEQAEIVARATALGAVHADIGQRDVPWVVLADPEGNEFCVLEPRPEYERTGAVAAIVVDAVDPIAQARFYAEATGLPVARTGSGFAALRAPGGPWLEFIEGGPKTVKARVHLDVRPLPGGDRDAEVARLREQGATSADIGQRDVPWTVLRDPEGGEFCVLPPR